METKELTFNDLPWAVALLLRKAESVEVLLSDLQKGQTQQSKGKQHRTMSVAEAAGYLHLPVNTVYAKLESGEIPATKPGKRYVLFQDELDKYLEVNRKNSVPLTPEEMNAAILATHRRKPSGLK